MSYYYYHYPLEVYTLFAIPYSIYYSRCLCGIVAAIAVYIPILCFAYYISYKEEISQSRR